MLPSPRGRTISYRPRKTWSAIESFSFVMDVQEEATHQNLVCERGYVNLLMRFWSNRLLRHVFTKHDSQRAYRFGQVVAAEQLPGVAVAQQLLDRHVFDRAKR